MEKDGFRGFLSWVLLGFLSALVGKRRFILELE